MEATLSDVQGVIDYRVGSSITTAIVGDEALSQENSTVNKVRGTKGNNRAAENDDSESDRPPVSHFFCFFVGVLCSV